MQTSLKDGPKGTYLVPTLYIIESISVGFKAQDICFTSYNCRRSYSCTKTEMIYFKLIRIFQMEIVLRYILLASYYTYRSYKCFYIHFLDSTVCLLVILFFIFYLNFINLSIQYYITSQFTRTVFQGLNDFEVMIVWPKIWEKDFDFTILSNCLWIVI